MIRNENFMAYLLIFRCYHALYRKKVKKKSYRLGVPYFGYSKYFRCENGLVLFFSDYKVFISKEHIDY